MTGDGQEPRIPARASVPDLFARLFGDARVWLTAEIALLKCRGEVLIAALRTAVILIVVAIMLASAATIALAVGLILTLATLVGPGWATLIVVVAMLAIAGVLGWLGYARIRRAIEDQS